MKKIMIAASVLLILLAFVSCNNDNKSLDGEVATTVAEELKPRDLVEKVLRDGDKDGLDISYDLKEVEKGAKPSYTHTLSVTVVFSGYEYSRVLTIERGRLTYTFYGTMAGTRFTSGSYELRTEEAMAVSGTSEGTVEVELSVDAREGSSGTRYSVTLTTDEEGKTVVEGSPSVSVTIPDDAVLSVGGTETKIPEEKPEYIPPTQYTITYVSDGETIGTAISAYLIQPSEAPTKTGYTLAGWILNDEETPVSSWNTRLNADVTLTAVWEINDTTKFVDPSSQAETEDGSEEAPYRTLAAALNDPDAEVIYVSAGMIALESEAPDYFQIERGVRIIGEGKAPVSFDENGRAVEVTVSNEITVMDGTIIVTTSEPVVIENMKLIQSVAPNDPSGKKPLVLANNSDSCDVSLIGCVIEPFANYRGVQALNVKAPVIVVDSSVVNVEASEGNSQRAAVCVLAGTFNEDISAKVSVLNSSLHVESDVTAWESIGIGADNIGSIDLSVVNSSVIAEGHGYGIRLLSVGSATKESIVDIKDSYIQGWGAIFATKNRDLEFVSKNALITVNDSILWGEGQSHDKHYGFSAIAITDSEDIEVNVNGGTVYANESTKPYVNFFDIQSSSNCSINFDDTEFIYSTGNDITGNFSLGSFAKAPNNSVSVTWDKFDTTAVQEPYTISLFNSVGLVEYYVIPNGYLLVVPDVPDGADHILPELCESGADIIEYLKKDIASGYQIYGIGRFDFAGLKFPADNLPYIYLLGAENNEEASLIIDNLKIEETLREKITTNGKVEINYI